MRPKPRVTRLAPVFVRRLPEFVDTLKNWLSPAWIQHSCGTHEVAELRSVWPPKPVGRGGLKSMDAGHGRQNPASECWSCWDRLAIALRAGLLLDIGSSCSVRFG